MKIIILISLNFFAGILLCASEKTYDLRLRYRKNEFYRYVTSYANDHVVRFPFLKKQQSKPIYAEHKKMQKESAFLVKHVYGNGNMLIAQKDILTIKDEQSGKYAQTEGPLSKILVRPDGMLLNLAARDKLIFDIQKTKMSSVDLGLSEASYMLLSTPVKKGQEFFQVADRINFKFKRTYRVAGEERRHNYDCVKIFFKEIGKVQVNPNKWADKKADGVIYFAYKKGIIAEIIEKGSVYYFEIMKINSNHLPVEKKVTFNNLTIIKENSIVRE
ncbi:hypothetical protein ACFL35_00900 [Candidatus Riflebacteria bacterium]